MSVDYNVYIGPYLRVTETVTVEQADFCKDHNRPDNSLYCPKCGCVYSNRYRTKIVSNAPEFWMEGFKKKGKRVNFLDYLFHTSSMNLPDIKTTESGEKIRLWIYLPNRYYKEVGVRLQGDYRENEGAIALGDLDMEHSKSRFITLFADEVEYLQQWFIVELYYGYVSWCS